MSDGKQTTLWVVGDSTVSRFEEDIYMPRYGWGTMLYRYFDERVTVCNLAISGTSSKSFRSTENYSQLLRGMRKGDFLMIGFGHNDEKRGEVTFTSGNGDYRTPGSFAHSLYQYYILPAREAGVECVLATPIPRRDPKMRYTGEFVHVTEDGDYPEAIRRLGRDAGVPVCDLTAALTEISKRVDQDEDPDNDTLFQHARTGSRPICVDDTHTSLFGAALNAYLIAEDVKRSNSGLKQYLKEKLEDPLLRAAFWKERSIRADYVEPVYAAPERPGDFWPVFTDENGNKWYGTVFGDINPGGPHNTGDFFLGENACGQMAISTGMSGNNGKIASKSDGIAMYFVRVPAKKRIYLSADIALDSFYTAGSCAAFSAFGVMVRDDMYIDRTNGSIMGDYVAAGITFRPGAARGSNTFARKNGISFLGAGELAQEPKTGEAIRMTVASTGDGYLAQVGENAPVIAGYDFALTQVDPEYVYVGIFSARTIGLHVEQIRLEIDGIPAEKYDCFAAL